MCTLNFDVVPTDPVVSTKPAHQIVLKPAVENVIAISSDDSSPILPRKVVTKPCDTDKTSTTTTDVVLNNSPNLSKDARKVVTVFTDSTEHAITSPTPAVNEDARKVVTPSSNSVEIPLTSPAYITRATTITPEGEARKVVTTAPLLKVNNENPNTPVHHSGIENQRKVVTPKTP